MEDEQGELSPSSTNEKALTFAESADILCAEYMAMGVSYNEFWHGNYAKLPYYYKAFELRCERANHDAWLQGAYVYDALCMVSPILHAFAKRGTKQLPYHERPYGMKSANKEADGATESTPAKTQKELEEIRAYNASAKFASFMTGWNKRFENESGGDSGTNDRPATNRNTGKKHKRSK